MILQVLEEAGLMDSRFSLVILQVRQEAGLMESLAVCPTCCHSVVAEIEQALSNQRCAL